jgi:RNA polymerase sigma-70 factor (ECF subfamily)
MTRPPDVGAAGPGIPDGEAFAARLHEELPRLVRLARQLVRDEDVAEDLAQDTMIAAWRRRGQLREVSALGGWLRRALVNRVIDRSRAERPTLDIATVEDAWRDDRFTVQPELVLERAELRDELEDALSHLPAILRLPVVLHDALGWSSPEVAAALGIGLPAAKQRLRRGRMMLVNLLADDDARRRASLAQPMRCWQARRHVSGYLDGELPDATRAGVEAHLAGCPTCPPLYAALVGIHASLSGLRDPDSVVDAQCAERIARRLDLDVRGPRRRRRGAPGVRVVDSRS